MQVSQTFLGVPHPLTGAGLPLRVSHAVARKHQPNHHSLEVTLDALCRFWLSPGCFAHQRGRSTSATDTVDFQACGRSAGCVERSRLLRTACLRDDGSCLFPDRPSKAHIQIKADEGAASAPDESSSGSDLPQVLLLTSRCRALPQQLKSRAEQIMRQAAVPTCTSMYPILCSLSSLTSTT